MIVFKAKEAQVLFVEHNFRNKKSTKHQHSQNIQGTVEYWHYLKREVNSFNHD